MHPFCSKNVCCPQMLFACWSETNNRHAQQTRAWPKTRGVFLFLPMVLLGKNQSAERLQLAAVHLHLHQNRVVQEACTVIGIDAGLEFHVAVGVRQEMVVVVRRRRRGRGLAVDEDAKLLGDDLAAAAAGGRGCGGGGEHGGRRGRGVVAAAGVVVGEVDGGDVVDAGAALVLATGVEADEVLLRVAGHLRRRPARHEVARDVPPVPAPVLLQTHQEQLVLLLRPGDALLALVVRPALALAATNHVAGALKGAQRAGVAAAAVPVEREPGGLRRAAAAAAVVG
uniref:ScMYB36 protein n=1 Tax=Saccharum hybrid cultivar Co 86032 TaxID=672234 RepID=A0A0C6WCR7_9POAL|nr:ScMYB36 protein [Saccharum hybrid cultivar Co 86032]